MVEIKEGFNPEENKISISVKTALIKKYYSNFSGLIKNGKGVPKGTTVERIDSDTASIIFPLPENSTFKKIDDMRGAVGIDAEKMGYFYSTISKFVSSALRREFKITEFLPIGNDYRLEDLQQDVKNAIKDKRNFAVLHTFAEYQESQRPIKEGEKREIEFNQVFVEYGTDLYSDIAILIQQGNMKELRKLIEPMFKLTKWA